MRDNKQETGQSYCSTTYWYGKISLSADRFGFAFGIHCIVCQSTRIRWPSFFLRWYGIRGYDENLKQWCATFENLLRYGSNRNATFEHHADMLSHYGYIVALALAHLHIFRKKRKILPITRKKRWTTDALREIKSVSSSDASSVTCRMSLECH